jgi:hypothetical protein
MVNRNLETKSTLKSIEATLDKNQVVSSEMQCELKGGCSNCEDSRRPPRVNGGNSQSGNWNN